ncbi:hypothetical protein DDB_G0271322 [Dictyostelium discoideum AX4]|uniref:Uncharacterized protein n=1 Tax=Dictyostelium discoideum TaxID=44689 RepID=Q55BG4_DICDI|nr:hypothetical protein DDB_G0271322 [Dictyostelium discoideum AX4]EAL71791.1 hypothetical protein DDB_G0271322 [Dictyostelium discoideum AX4]|eukprot:XP_645648.1 hypothetical protein DDB_G0271322 [Dictyostelium discoideum AX4]
MFFIYDKDNDNNCELEKKNLKSIKEIAKSYYNIEPIEILFWKLFRNKAIYKKIFSFMYNQYSFSYDSVSSITKLIDSNQISILKEKVYRNCRYLEFGETCWRKESDQSSWRKDLILIYLKKLFEIIKNDFKFYRNFFKIQRYYYSSPIYVSTAIIQSKNLENYL